MVTHMSRKRRSKRHMKRYSKHSKTHIKRNMYRKKHKKTQRGGGPQEIVHFKTVYDRPIQLSHAIPTPAVPAMPTRAVPAMPTRADIPWYIRDDPYRPITAKDVMPEDFLPPGWKIVLGEDNRKYFVPPGCHSIFHSESRRLKQLLQHEFDYQSKIRSKVPPKLPTPHESPKSPNSSKSSAPPKSSTSHESPKSHKSPKSSKSSKSK